MTKPRVNHGMSADDPTTRAVAAMIAALREESGSTQEDLAAAVGKTQPYVSARVRLKLPWTTNDLEALAVHFGMDPFDFFLLAEQYAEPVPPSPGR